MNASAFELASGSVIGRAHLQPLGWRNNQDAFAVLDLTAASGIAVGVIADGCSSGPVKGGISHHEVGAKLAAPMIARAILSYIPQYLKRVENGGDALVFPYWEDVRQDLLAHLRIIAPKMDPNFVRVVSDYFLFTLIGFLVTPHASFVFSIGDGVCFVNGEKTRIGPFPGNEPPYVGYSLLRQEQHRASPEATKFTIIRALPTAEVQSILVGSDGLDDFILNPDKPMPGNKKGKVVGEISQFWEKDEYYANGDAVRRKLALANNSHMEPDWENADNQRIIREPGLLADDTTLAVIRRKKPQPKKEVT